MGDVQPTMLMPYTLENGAWVCKFVIELVDRMDTHAQKTIIEYVANQFPDILAISIDCTSSPAMADIIEGECPWYKEKVVRVLFNSSVAYSEDRIDTVEKQDAYLRQEGKKYKMGDVVEKKMKTKTFSTMQGKTLLANRQIMWHYDPSLIEDFSSEITIYTASGDRIDTPSNVHRPEVFRCFVMAWWQKIYMKELPETDASDWYMPTQISTGFFGKSERPSEGRIDGFGGVYGQK
jgi:hypothetical protein